MPRRVFVVGQRGQVARALACVYAPQDCVVTFAGRAAVDIADSQAVLAAVREFGPDLIINAAAYTAVDAAEDDAAGALAINRDGARNIARAAQAAQAPLIHFSSDYVFDGGKDAPYVETDRPSPIGAYGRSKLAGEAAVMAETPSHVVLRSSWICSPHGHNFVRTMLRLAGERDEIDVVDDQWGNPTFAIDLANLVFAIGERILSSADPDRLYGLYHAAGAGDTTWCRFARRIMAVSAAKNGPSCRVRPIATGEYPTRSRRPMNSRLDCSKLARVFDAALPRWEVSLEACIDRIIHAPAESRL